MKVTWEPWPFFDTEGERRQAEQRMHEVALPGEVLTVATKIAVKQRDGFACVRCGARNKLTIDHIKPRREGGGNELENLRTLCRPCHQQLNKGLWE